MPVVISPKLRLGRYGGARLVLSGHLEDGGPRCQRTQCSRLAGEAVESHTGHLERGGSDSETVVRQRRSNVYLQVAAS